jgi:hypothetical protein
VPALPASFAIPDPLRVAGRPSRGGCPAAQRLEHVFQGCGDLLGGGLRGGLLRIVAGGAVQVTDLDGGLYQEIANLPLVASSLTFHVSDGVYEPDGVNGFAVAPLEIQLSGSATLAGLAGQSININDVATPTVGSLALAQLPSRGTTINGLTSLQGDVTLQSALSILDGIDRSRGAGIADIRGNNITLSTGGTTGSTIGTAAANLLIDSALTAAGMLTATTNQNAYVIEKNGDLTLDQVNAPFGTVYLTAPSGSILNGHAAQASPPSNIVAVKAYLTAGGNVGPLNTQVSYLEGRAGSATSDSFTVSNTGPAVVGNVTTDPNAAGVQAGGAVTIATHRPLTVTQNVLANQDVQLGGTDHAGENDDLIIQAGVTVQAVGVFGDGILQSGGNVLFQGGDGVTVQGGTAQLPAATIMAANTVTIQDDSTPAGVPDPDSTDGPPTIAVNGTINAPVTEIVGGAAGDTFNLQGALFGNVFLQGGAGNDTITINPAGIAGTLTVDAGGGSNRLIVNDSDNSTASPTVTVTSGSITGFGPGTIHYSASGGSFTDANGNDGISITGSATQPTTFNVQSTLAGSTTRIQGGAGSTVVVGSRAPNLGGTLANIGGTLSVGNDVSRTGLTLDDSGSGTAKQVTLTDQGITGLAPAPIDFVPTQLSALVVVAGSGGNTCDLSGFSHAATIDGGTGAANTLSATKDVARFTLADNELQTSDGMDVRLAHFGMADLTGGALASTFDVSGWTGTGTLNGGGGQDTVVANDNASVTLADSALDRTGAGRLALEGIHNADLTDSGGSHAFDVGGWTGSGSVTGGGSSDTITATKNADFTLTNTALVTGDGMNLTLASIGTANLTGGAGNHTFDVGGWTGTGTLTGDAGKTDTVVATKNAASCMLADRNLGTSDGMSLNLSNLTRAQLTGGPGNTAFDVSGWTGTGSLDGGGSRATVVARKAASFVLTNQELKTTDGMDLALRGIGAGDLTGTSGHDTFDVSGWAGTLTLHGGGGGTGGTGDGTGGTGGGTGVGVTVRGNGAQLIMVKVGKKKKLLILVTYADTGAKQSQITSPFQKPTYKNIQVTVEDTNGDGVPDTVVLTAKKGKQTVTTTLAG